MSIDYQKIKKYVSSPRLQKYEIVCNNSPRKSLKLYQTNLRLSQAFYPVLSLYEIVLRNAINEELINYFNDQNWLKNQLTGFMNDPSLKYYNKRKKTWITNEYLKNCVYEAQRKSNYSTLHYKVVAELKLGYWSSLFDPTNYKILNGRPIRIFNKLPSGTSRSNIFDKITHIRDFRNRIYHNEPIIFVKGSSANPKFDINKCKQVYKEIQDIFCWLGLDFHLWTKHINNIPFELKRAKCVYKHYPNRKYYIKRILIGCNHYRNKYLLKPLL